MSCFIHNTEDYINIYSFFKKVDWTEQLDEILIRTLNELQQLEVDVFNERYNEKEEFININFEINENEFNEWDCLRLLDSINYQVASGTDEQWDYSKRLTSKLKEIIACFFNEVNLENDNYKDTWQYDMSDVW